MYLHLLLLHLTIDLFFGVAKFFSPTIDNWSDGKELVFGCLLIFIITDSYLFAVRLARRPALA